MTTKYILYRVINLNFLMIIIILIRARTFIPGPIAILWHDFIVDNIQIALAASAGAAAITLSPELCECNNDLLQSQVDFCKELNVEPVMLVKNEEEVNVSILIYKYI